MPALLASARFLMPMPSIKKANIAITNRCNLKCLHCDIWKQSPKIDLEPQLLARLLRDPELSGDLDLTLTGGEPFLHPEIWKVLDTIFMLTPSALKTISTNGMLKGKIIEFLRRYAKVLPADFSLHISLDGIKNHRKIRGVSASALMKNLCLIRRTAPKLDMKIKFTITPLNYSDIIPVYSYAKDNGMDFKVKLVEYAAHYTNRIVRPPMDFGAKAKEEIANSLLKIYRLESGDPKSARFIRSTISLLRGEKKPIMCRAPFERIFVFADGAVHSCIHFPSIGSFKEEPLRKIWGSRKAALIRGKVQEKGCNRCVAFHGFSGEE